MKENFADVADLKLRKFWVRQLRPVLHEYCDLIEQSNLFDSTKARAKRNVQAIARLNLLIGTLSVGQVEQVVDASNERNSNDKNR